MTYIDKGTYPGSDAQHSAGIGDPAECSFAPVQ